MPELHVPVVLDIDVCEPVDWNPNVEDVATFNELVKSIENEGFLEPIIVVPMEGDRFRIVGGEHRWKAAKLAGMTQITAIVKEEWDEDQVQVQNIKLNEITGSMDPERFAAVWIPLEKKYGRRDLARMMGMEHKEKEIERLLQRVKRSMPKEIADELEKRSDKIRNVEDLATVVQSLYAQLGRTLDSSYMFLTFGGKLHTMIKMTDWNQKMLGRILTKARDNGEDANELLESTLQLVIETG